MENYPRRRTSKADFIMRVLVDSGRGLVIFGVGLFFLIAPQLGISLAVDGIYRYMLSGLFLLYGGWRIYRGYSKNINS
jgi:hypothetical protein